MFIKNEIRIVSLQVVGRLGVIHDLKYLQKTDARNETYRLGFNLSPGSFNIYCHATFF